MQIGLKAGLNIANVGGDDADHLFEIKVLIQGLVLMEDFSLCTNSIICLLFNLKHYYTMKGATTNLMGADITIEIGLCRNTCSL